MIPNDLTNHPRIEMVPRTSLRPNPRNPRTHSKKQLLLISSALQRWGFLVPLICDDDGNIVAGNARWEASGLAGFDELPVIRTKFVSEADKRAFALAENRLSELGGWDFEIIEQELEFLLEHDFDIGLTGFDFGHLDVGLGTSTAVEEPIELPAPGAVAVSRLGDLWFNGPHRLHHGNSRLVESFETLLGSELPHMIVSDAPYNVPIGGNVTRAASAREFAEACGEMTAPEFTAFLRVIFRNCARFSKDGSIHIQFMDWRHMREMLDAADGVYTELKQLAVWDKQVGGMGSCLRSQHELAFIFKSGKAPHTNNVSLEKGRYRTNLWSYPNPNMAHQRKGPKDETVHPTQKSLAMLCDALLDFSNRADLILDPFSGSGQTLLAAHRTQRRGAAIEIDPLFVDLGLKRLAAATGLPTTLSDGRTFDEVAADREREQAND
jgi:DNA modification methylase